MRQRLVLAALLILGLLAACGDDEPSAWAKEPLPCGPGEYASKFEAVPELAGLDLGDAKDRAKELGYEVRMAGEDGSCEGGTDDLDSKRVNLYADDGEVVWAMLY